MADLRRLPAEQVLADAQLTVRVQELTDIVMARNGLARECADLRDELDAVRGLLAAAREDAAEQFAERTAADVRAEQAAGIRERLTLLLADWDARAARYERVGHGPVVNTAANLTRGHATEVRLAANLP